MGSVIYIHNTNIGTEKMRDVMGKTFSRLADQNGFWGGEVVDPDDLIC